MAKRSCKYGRGDDGKCKRKPRSRFKKQGIVSRIKRRFQRGRWQHQGGGCFIGGGDPGAYNCDDIYEHEETGKSVYLETSEEAHFDMPRRVEKLTDLTRRPGIRLVDRDKE
jgi:hypothetical protein